MSGLGHLQQLPAGHHHPRGVGAEEAAAEDAVAHGELGVLSRHLHLA